MNTATRNDELTRNNSAFKSFDQMLEADGGYSPSIDVSDADKLELADAYDAAQADRNDDRRAFRYGTPFVTPTPAPVTPVSLSKEIKNLSDKCMKETRRATSNHVGNRGVEIIGLDSNGERVEEYEFFDKVSEVSGKAIKNAVASFEKATHFCIEGGADEYNGTFAEFMQAGREGWASNFDYEPMAGTWETEIHPVTIFNK